MIEAAIFCLALNAYHEARHEGPIAMLAVAQVAIQRAEDTRGRWPRDVCAVVFQGGERRHRCQFSWYCDGKSDAPREAQPWASALGIAEAALRGVGLPALKGATCYHASWARKPAWARKARFILRWKDHLFYEC